MSSNERWTQIPDFPIYSVSNLGRIRNDTTGRMMSPTPSTPAGHLKISLLTTGIVDGELVEVRRTVSVALLVAAAYVRVPDVLSNAVVILNGDLSDVAAKNLVWRPRWYAWKYRRQLLCQQPLHFHNLRVRNISTGQQYLSIVRAGMTEGILFDDIWRSCCTPPPNRPRIYPFGHMYMVTQRV